MKKMIPVYVLQIAMLATFVFVSLKVLREMQSIKTELAATKADSAARQPRTAPAMRVVVMNPIEISR